MRGFRTSASLTLIAGLILAAFALTGCVCGNTVECPSGEGENDDNAPSASINVSSSSKPVGEAITFDASNSVDSAGSTVSAQEIVSYEWEFGDGDTATGQQVSHRYTKSGDYTVTLTVTDNEGATDTTTHTIKAIGKVYWTAPSAGKILRANLDGTDIETLVTGIGDSRGLALDPAHGKMYWSVRTAGKIQRANLDGTNVENVITGLGDPRGLALDLAQDKAYWTATGNHKVRRANLDGTNIETLVSGLVYPNTISLDLSAGKMYWGDWGADKIRRANLDGTNVETVIDGGQDPIGIALDRANKKIYWRTDPNIHRANLDGSNEVTLVSVDEPNYLALDLVHNEVVWANGSKGKIKWANLDGTSVEELITGSDSEDPFAIELTP